MQGSAHSEVIVGELVPEVVEGGVVGVEVVVVEVFVVVVVNCLPLLSRSCCSISFIAEAKKLLSPGLAAGFRGVRGGQFWLRPKSFSGSWCVGMKSASELSQSVEAEKSELTSLNIAFIFSSAP